MFENTFFFKAAVEIQQLWLGTTMFIAIIVLLSKTKIFNEALIEKEFSLNSKLFLILVFSVLGILGTYWGIVSPMGVINTRAIGVIAGGLIGGPVVGIGTGLITGLHRIVSVHTFSAVQSGMITMVQGIVAGFLSIHVKNKTRMWPWAMLVGFLLECLHMVLLLLFAKPYESAVALVQIIAPSMLLTNTIGIGLFIGILEDNYKRLERTSSQATRLSFKVVNLLVQVFKEKESSQTAATVVKIISESIPSLNWVAIVDQQDEIILKVRKDDGHADQIKEQVRNRDYPHTCQGVVTGYTQDYSILAVPVRDGEIVTDVIVVGKKGQAVFSSFERELLSGLCSLLEVQLNVSKLNQQALLLSEAEVKVLQAQINPHFLFNALNTISYYCRSEPARAKDLVVYLAEYYRHSLSNPKTFIEFQQEIQHVQAYLNIETARFGDRLKVEYDIPPGVSFKVPSLILQPLVENAVKHGILTKEDGGTVYIGVIPQDEVMKVYVYDNGMGIPPEKQKTLLTETRPAEDGRTYKSIGLKNVQQRLLAIYGPENGLQIVSKPNIGTSVTFTIPREKGATL
jgi:two-component system sensor histidine kinase LytS